VLQTNLSQNGSGLFLRFVGFGQLGSWVLACFVKSSVGSLALGLAMGFSISLGLGALGSGLAEGVQDGALLLDEVWFGHGLYLPSMHATPRLGDDLGKTLHLALRDWHLRLQRCPVFLLEIPAYRIIP
jgi:hypothetical protein